MSLNFFQFCFYIWLTAFVTPNAAIELNCSKSFLFKKLVNSCYIKAGYKRECFYFSEVPKRPAVTGGRLIVWSLKSVNLLSVGLPVLVALADAVSFSEWDNRRSDFRRGGRGRDGWSRYFIWEHFIDIFIYENLSNYLIALWTSVNVMKSTLYLELTVTSKIWLSLWLMVCFWANCLSDALGFHFLESQSS